MSDIWGSLTKLFNLNAKKIYIDNFGFRLHYKVTTAILVLCGILVTSRQYFGDPIDCITHTAIIQPILDQYCWVHGTFRNRNGPKNTKYLGANEREFQEFPGAVNPDRERDYRTYYQWVWIVLFIQAACFYLAHFIWKTWECGRMKEMIGSLNSHVLEDAVKTKHQATILKFFATHSGIHRLYAAKYFICEVLCLINVLVQMLLINNFIGNKFVKYGLNIFQQQYGGDPTDRDDDSITDVFPYVTFCVMTTNDFVTTKAQEAMCILPINVLNRRIYMFLWFWCLFLICTSFIAVVYSLITVLSPRIRKWRLRQVVEDDDTIKVIVRCSNFGNWFFVYQLGRNMNPVYFAELLRDLAASWETQSSVTRSHTPVTGGGAPTDASKASLLPLH